MDPEKRSLIATALVGVVVLAIIVGSIYYLIQFIRNRQAGNTANQVVTSASTVPLPSGSGTVQFNQGQLNAQPQQVGDFKLFNEGEYQITYPQNWGLLTCNNSANIEFDPANGQDQLKVECQTAVKPVTVIKNATGCLNGEMVDLGQVKVTRTKATDGDYTRYEWCTKTLPALYITHRISGSNEQATSREDFSKQIEDMISKLSFVRGS